MQTARLITDRLVSNLIAKPRYSPFIPRYALQQQVCCIRSRHFSSSNACRTSITKHLNSQSRSVIETEKEPRRTRSLSRIGLEALVFLTVVYGGIRVYHHFSTSTDPVFDPPRFTPCEIIAKDNISPTSFILTIRPRVFAVTEPSSDPYKRLWEQGTWSVEFKQPELQIARSYTPLPPSSNPYKQPRTGDLQFLIRREHKGEVSVYLSQLNLGSTIEIRGPTPEVDLPQYLTSIVFLAGGTGIAPALQLVYTLLEARDHGQNDHEELLKPKIHIVWANRSREDCKGGTSSIKSTRWEKTPEKLGGPPSPIVKELQNLQLRHPKHLNVDYLVDEEGNFLDQKKISRLTQTESEVKVGAMITGADSKLIVVSGPEGFVNYLAGSKLWEEGKEVQGPLGGIIGRMRLGDWKVYKL